MNKDNEQYQKIAEPEDKLKDMKRKRRNECDKYWFLSGKEMIAKIVPILHELRCRLDVYEFMKGPHINKEDFICGFSEINITYFECLEERKELIDDAFSCEEERKEFINNLEIVRRHMEKLFG